MGLLVPLDRITEADMKRLERIVDRSATALSGEERTRLLSELRKFMNSYGAGIFARAWIDGYQSVTGEQEATDYSGVPAEESNDPA